VDVKSTAAVAGLVQRLAHAESVPDVFILNAGINRIDNDQAFELATYREVIETNLYGALNFVEPLTCLPSSPSPRHVIAISSMAAYVGNPYGLGYHTSKRALSACFDVWGKMYEGTDLVFQQVILGPVPTGIYTMSDELSPWMVRIRNAFSASLEDTVRAIARFARTEKNTLFYPPKAVPLFLGMRFGQSVIPGFFQGRKTLRGITRRAARSARTPRKRVSDDDE
jgi:NAD(P)-dependent dehydrogenase (short-subunit alcohol dehydrogenase family)